MLVFSLMENFQCTTGMQRRRTEFHFNFIFIRLSSSLTIKVSSAHMSSWKMSVSMSQTIPHTYICWILCSFSCYNKICFKKLFSIQNTCTKPLLLNSSSYNCDLGACLLSSIIVTCSVTGKRAWAISCTCRESDKGVNITHACS